MKEKEKLDSRILAIAKRIRELRVKKGYTSYEKFAFDNDLSRVGYGNHEKGRNIRMSSLLRIIDIHGITLEQFFKGIK
jgi:hypothetical protein